MKEELLEDFVLKINELQKQINKEYEKEFNEILNKK